MVVQPAALAFQALFDQPEQEFAAEVAECGRFVGVHVQRVGMHNQSFVLRAC